MTKVICEDYEKTFDGVPKAFICPECRKKRLSEYAKKRKLNRLGLIAQGKKVRDDDV